MKTTPERRTALRKAATMTVKAAMFVRPSMLCDLLDDLEEQEQQISYLRQRAALSPDEIAHIVAQPVGVLSHGGGGGV
jgi:hypothetical protein